MNDYKTSRRTKASEQMLPRHWFQQKAGNTMHKYTYEIKEQHYRNTFLPSETLQKGGESQNSYQQPARPTNQSSLRLSPGPRWSPAPIIEHKNNKSISTCSLSRQLYALNEWMIDWLSSCGSSNYSLQLKAASQLCININWGIQI